MVPKPQPKKIAQLNVPSQAKVTKFSDTDEEDSMNDKAENGNHGVKKSDSENSNMSIRKRVYDENVDSLTLSQETSSSTGKSLSEALILGSTNPQYDKILFIDLPVQYMKTTSSEHVVYTNCFLFLYSKQFMYTTCSLHVLSLEFSGTY